MRSAKEYLSSLNDGRTIYINGEAVGDVTTHHAFRNVATSMAGLFDFANAPANRELMTFDTEAGRANRIWQLPISYTELVERRKALEAWASLHAGFLGRAPDHVASCISGLYMGLDVFKAYDPARAGALEAYYRYARDNDLYLIDHKSGRAKPLARDQKKRQQLQAYAVLALPNVPDIAGVRGGIHFMQGDEDLRIQFGTYVPAALLRKTHVPWLFGRICDAAENLVEPLQARPAPRWPCAWCGYQASCDAYKRMVSDGEV